MSAEAIESKIREQALRESESKYRFLFENMIDGFAYHKVLFGDNGKPVDYIYLEVNDAFEKMTGLKKENVVGRRLTEVIPGIEHDKAGWIEIYGRVTLTGEPVRFENYSETLKRWFAVTAYSPGSPYFATVFEDITARKQAEAEASAHQMRLAEALEAADMVTWEWDIPTRSIRYSDNIGAIVRGVAVEPYCSLDKLMPQIHPEDRKGLAQALDQTSKKGTPFQCEYRVHMLDGTYRWILGKGKRVVMEDGKPVRVLGLSMDITERKRTEGALRESEQRFRQANELLEAVTKGTNVIIAAQDLELRYTYFNTAYATEIKQLTGKAIQIGFSMAELFADQPDQLAVAEQEWREALEGKTTHKRLEFGDPSRRRRGYDILHTPIRDTNGLIVGAGEVAYDVTEYMQAEQEIYRLAVEAENERRRLRALMESLPVGVALTDIRGSDLTSNKAFEQIWGTPRPRAESLNDYVSYKAWWSATGKPVAPEEWASAQAVQKGQAIIGQLMEIERFDGSRASVINSGAPIFDEDGKIVGCAVAIQDITDLRKAEQALRESEARTTAILNSISDGFMTLDNNLVVTYFNQEAENLLGRQRGDVLGRNLFEAFPEAKGSVFEQKYTWAVKEKERTAFETYFGIEPYENWYDVRVFPHEHGLSIYFRVITDQKRAEAATLQAKEKFEILAETASKLLATDTPQDLVNGLCREVMTYLDCHAFFNYLFDPTQQHLHLNAWAGIPEQTAKEIEWLDYGVAVCGCAARDAARIVCENIPVTPDPRTELVKSFGIKAYACHPLFSGDRVIGTLSFGTRTRSTFTEEDLSMMKTVADQVALALERRGLLLSLQERAEELDFRVRERTAELQRATELLETIFSSIRVLIAYMDREFNFIRVNRAYAEADERTPEFYVGKNHFRLFSNAENEAIFRKVVETGEPYFTYQKPFEYAEHPERGVTYWDWSIHPVKEPDGMVSGVVLTLVNVTERVRAQEKWRQNEELLRTTMNLLPLGLWITDKEGRIIRTNPAGLRIWAGAKYVGIDQFQEYKAWWADSGKRVEPEDWAVARAARKGETSIDEELEIQCFDGTRKFILNSAVPIRNEEQKVTGVVVVNQDITDRKQKEQLLEESENRLHQLSSRLLTLQEDERKRIAREIHDGIGQSLSAIKFRLENALQQNGRDKTTALEELVPLLRGCIEEARRMQTDLRPALIDDLGILPTLNWFCREFEKTYGHIRIEKHLSLQEQEVPDLLKIVIFRILQEAMNNIAKHSKATRVDLSLRKMDDSVEMAVQDDGEGFDFHVILSRGSLERGMGLDSMRERAELSGGFFTIDSAQGKGTTVRATWPLIQNRDSG